MRVQLKLLLPILAVAGFAALVNFYLHQAIHAADDQRRSVDFEASVLIDAVAAAQNAWRDASIVARSEAYRAHDADAQSAFARKLHVARSNLQLIGRLGDRIAAQGEIQAVIAALDAWAAAAGPDARGVVDMRAVVGRERALADQFSSVTLKAIDHAKHMRDVVAKSFEEELNAAVASLWIVSALAAGVGLYLARSTITPLTRLAAQAERIADGGAVAKFKPLDRKDEIGQLSSALARMMASVDEKTLRIERMAYVDLDTGLPNRAKLHATVSARAETGVAAQTLIIVAVEGWDKIQSLLGSSVATKAAHGVSARLAAKVARAPLPAIRRSDPLLARLQPNAFALLLSGAPLDAEALHAVTAALGAAFDTPFQVDERLLRFTPKFAVSTSEVAGQGGDQLVNTALLALDEASATRGRATSIFTVALRERVIERRELEERMRVALEREEFELHFQPFVTADGDEIWGAEALVRWRREDGELLPPGRFIPVAEESGLIAALDDWVVGEACRAARRWRDAGLDLVVSANVSPLRFEQDGFEELVAHALDAADLPAQLLKIEITETAAMADPAQTSKALAPVKDLGVQLAIDDFGSGYSNLSTLASLPFDCLKIDRGLLPTTEADADAAQITRAVAELARHLGLWTIAEGVETAWQADFARRIGCHVTQGFYYCRPKPEAEFLAYVRGFGAPTDKRVAGGF